MMGTLGAEILLMCYNLGLSLKELVILKGFKRPRACGELSRAGQGVKRNAERFKGSAGG
jgi:hypothetical protein